MSSVPTDLGFLMPAVALLMCTICVPGWGAGQAAGIRHPVYDYGVTPDRSEELEKAVAQAMALSEEQLVALVPDKHFTRFCHCPACFGGVDADTVFTWSVERPRELTCRYCGFVWSPEGPYKEDKVLSGPNSLGETISYNYYEHPEKGTKHFFSLNCAYYARGWLTAQVQTLGKAYLATGKAAYARRVALVIDRMAQVYPHLAVIKVGGIPNRYFEVARSQEPPYTWDAGKWGWHSPGGELPSGVIEAYDMIYDSPELNRLSQERGYDVRQRIEEEFLKPTMAAVRATPDHVSNYVAYLGTAAVMGRVINQPEWVHWAFGWIARNVYAGCFYDGMWHESPSYHYMTTAGLRRCFEAVRGYSDPTGHVGEDGRRFDNLDPEKTLPFWGRVQHAPEVVDLPNGCSATFHDTWAGERRSQPRESTASTILPGMGQVALGRGSGADQLQAQMHFSGAYGHSHRDCLAMMLWAKQREMLSDIGYTWSDIRSWSVSTISHNLVAVDCREQKTANSDGDLVWFFPDNAGVSATEVDGTRAYADVAGLDMYRRLQVVVPVSARDAYVVDVFRVRGGTVHDWLLHGDADEDTTASCSPALGEPAKDMLAYPPSGEVTPAEAYGFIRQVRAGTAESGFTADLTYPSDPARGLRVHAMPPGPVEVFLGQSPSIRRTGRGSQADNRKIWDYWMPSLVVRRDGSAPLTSAFAAVYEPYVGEGFVQSVERLAVGGGDETAVALRVTHGNTVDTIISTLDTPPYPTREAGGMGLEGRLGIVRWVGGRVAAVWLFEGVRVSADGGELAPKQAQLVGTISGATRQEDGAESDALLTSSTLPAGAEMQGLWMVVTHGNGFSHGYPIERVEERSGESAVVTGLDHGLRMEGDTTREVFFPQREIGGANTFVIPLCASWVRQGE